VLPAPGVSDTFTATTLTGPSIKNGFLGGYILKKRQKRTEIRLAADVTVAPPSELMRTVLGKNFESVSVEE